MEYIKHTMITVKKSTALFFIFIFFTCFISAQTNSEKSLSKKEKRKIEKFERIITNLEKKTFSFQARWRAYKSKRFEMIYPDYKFLKVKKNKVTSSLVYGESLVIALRDQHIRDYDKVMINLSSEVRDYQYMYDPSAKKAIVSFTVITDKNETFFIKIETTYENTIMDILSDKRDPVRYEGIIRS